MGLEDITFDNAASCVDHLGGYIILIYLEFNDCCTVLVWRMKFSLSWGRATAEDWKGKVGSISKANF